MVAHRQKIVVFQQGNSGLRKVEGIRRFGKKRFRVELVNIDHALPPVIDDTRPFLPKDIQADVVLDFLRHPDLSHDLALICRRNHVPLIASGKKDRVEGTYTPPT